MTPAAEPSPSGNGYAASLLARHVLLCLTHMRRVVREMVEAGAGWGAFAAATAVAAFAIALETAVREALAPPTDPALAAAEFSDLAILGGSTFALFVAIAIFLTIVWWAASRLFGARITLLTSALGVAAGALPQVAFSAAVIVFVCVLHAVVGAERGYSTLEIADFVIMLPLLGYGVVAYSAASGFTVLQTFGVQLVGALLKLVLG